jgi:hypothetical protein
MGVKLNLLFLLFPFYITSQITFNTPEGNAVSFLTKNKDYADVEAEGSPYLGGTAFKNGGVFVRDSLEMRGALRYNAYRSEIEVADNDISYFSLLKRPYITAEIAERLFKMYNYKDAKNLDRVAYFNPLNAGDMVLLFKPEVKLKRGRVPSTSYDRLVPPKFIDISSYYIKIGEEPAREVKLKKKTFIGLLRDKKDQVSGFIEKNDLNLRHEEDVISLLNYYNTLE